MRIYGLPYTDVAGVYQYDDLQDPQKARRMGEVMQQRMGRGDVATNLIVTSLVANAYLMTGEDKYRHWVEDTSVPGSREPIATVASCRIMLVYLGTSANI